MKKIIFFVALGLLLSAMNIAGICNWLYVALFVVFAVTMLLVAHDLDNDRHR